MQTSANGRKFTELQEGSPKTAYKDVVGVPTVGPGFTNRSSTVTKMIGKIVPGKTKLTQEQIDRVFSAVLAEEVEPSINKKLAGCDQFEFDAASSGCYNLGVGMLTWNWAKMWRAGKKNDAWSYYGSHYNTAGGKKYPGLVRRRKEERAIALDHYYPGVTKQVAAYAPPGVARQETEKPLSVPDPVVKEAQELLTANGFNPGAIDGWMGANTKKALLAYQKAHPHLVNDGILGPATISQLRRDASAVSNVVKETVKKGGGASAVASGMSLAGGVPIKFIIIGVGVLAAAVAGYYLWKNRDIFIRRSNTKNGVTVNV